MVKKNFLLVYCFVTDPSFTVENICSVMTTPNWKEVWSTLLPASRLEKIENECSEVEEQTRACAIVFYSHWNVSWQTLAHSLYIWNHQLILEKLKCFLPPRGDAKYHCSLIKAYCMCGSKCCSLWVITSIKADQGQSNNLTTQDVVRAMLAFP